MTYIITEPCVGVCDTACVDVCPVDCIYPAEGFELDDDGKKKMMDAKEQLYIHPEECIDCGACEPECPVEAIFPEDEVPEKWQSWIQKNADKAKVLPLIIERKEPLS